MIRKQHLLAVLCSAALALAGCKKDAAGSMGGAFPPVQVVAVEARREAVIDSLSLVGSVAAEEVVEIHSEIDGTVQDIKFDEGKPVEKGQLLIQLDPTKLAASAEESESIYKLSEANFERVKRLLSGNLIAQQEYDQAASVYEVAKATLARRKRELADTQIFAPFSGVVGKRMISPGQVISKDSKLTWLVALDTVKVEMDVPERFLGQVNTGQKIEITVAAYPGEHFKGEVFFIAPQVDSATRTALVKARVPNESHRLKPGMFANLDLTLKLKDDAVVIPESALILNADSVSVFVVDKEQKAQIRVVKIGVRMPGRVEVTEGISAGEQVIIEGFQKTRPGAPVKVVAAAAQAETAKAQ